MFQLQEEIFINLSLFNLPKTEVILPEDLILINELAQNSKRTDVTNKTR